MILSPAFIMKRGLFFVLYLFRKRGIILHNKAKYAKIFNNN